MTLDTHWIAVKNLHSNLESANVIHMTGGLTFNPVEYANRNGVEIGDWRWELIDTTMSCCTFWSDKLDTNLCVSIIHSHVVMIEGDI